MVCPRLFAVFCIVSKLRTFVVQKVTRRGLCGALRDAACVDIEQRRRVFAGGVDEVDGVAFHIGVGVEPTSQSNRVSL